MAGRAVIDGEQFALPEWCVKLASIADGCGERLMAKDAIRILEELIDG